MRFVPQCLFLVACSSTIALAQTTIATSHPATEESSIVAGAIRDLSSGDDKQQLAAIDKLGDARNVALDDALFNAIQKCAESAAPRVQAEIARTLGGKWIWTA